MGKWKIKAEGKEKGWEKEEERKNGLRQCRRRRRLRRYILRREDLVTGKLVIRLFNEISLLTTALARVVADFSETVLIKMYDVSRQRQCITYYHVPDDSRV